MMPASDFQGSAASFGRSILSFRRDQIHAMDSAPETDSCDLELERFQRQVAHRFSDLSSVGSDDLLSLSWIRKLLNSFLRCQEEFRAILLNNKSHICKSPLDRMVHEYFERSVKALDLCNAIRDGIEQIREWKKLIEIVLCALDNQRMIGEGQLRRAKKALIDLHISMLDEKESSAALANRCRSFGRQTAASSKDNLKNLVHFRSLLSSISRSWSAARQLQAISSNLAAPKANEIAATNGIAVVVYTMSSILVFVMWALVAAIPCQDRGFQVHFSVPRNFLWSVPIMSLYESIMDESRKRDRRNACGLLREIYLIDKCTKLLAEMADSVQFPLAEEREMEVRLRVQELRRVSELMKTELDPLERQVREVFHRIVHSRTEGLDSLGRMSLND